MSRLARRCCWLIAVSLLGAEWLRPELLRAEDAVAEQAVDYVRQIKPVLRERCYACHGALKQEAGLRLDTIALATRGGDSGAAIDVREVAQSLILQRVMATVETERMPPEGEPLSVAQLSLFKTWIAQGAKGPADEPSERDPRDHWAFQTPVRPAVPQDVSPAWSRNPIDAFLAARHRQQGLQPQRPADKRVWLRRVSLDLVGLPPTRVELDAFVADTSEQAHEAVVTKLLDSPQYGERWGRHWMDVWRYSDWWGLGAEVRNSQKHIWHWRDWIIESLNADKGYDQMLREMLAADELYPNDLDRLRASGFLARQYFKFNRTSWLDETVEHTSKAMLGLTFNCAKCHDHKYDPIAQTDYYKLRAIFEPYQVRTDLLPGETDYERNGLPRAFDGNLDAQTFLHVRGDDRNPDQSRVMEATVPAFLSQVAWKIEPVTLPPEAHQPGLRPFIVEDQVKVAELKIIAARAAVETARQKRSEVETMIALPADALLPINANPNGGSQPGPPLTVAQAKLAIALSEKALAVAETQPVTIRARAAAGAARHRRPQADNANELARAAVKLERLAAVAQAEEAAVQAELDVTRAAADKQAEAEKKLLTARTALETARAAVEMPGENFTPLNGALKTLENNLETEDSRRKPFPTTSTGRRTALAHWITDPRHPLPARVAANHVWLRHFGRPLVPTVFDFGRKGTPPTHPELLDWLAVELVEHQWSLKHIHRLIVTSQAYRLSSSSAGATADTLAGDPDNQFYWRANPMRMEAQLVRDSLLHLAGELDLTRGGPSIPATDETSQRRSLYFVHSHNEHQKFLSMFDDASVLDCYRRAESIVPQQALALENSPLATAMGEKIARRLIAAQPTATDTEFIHAAFLTVLGVEPSADETSLAVSGLSQLTEAARQNARPDPSTHARTQLIHALLNHNDFVTIR